jgi:hypothetical protein
MVVTTDMSTSAAIPPTHSSSLRVNVLNSRLGLVYCASISTRQSHSPSPADSPRPLSDCTEVGHSIGLSRTRPRKTQVLSLPLGRTFN